MRLLALWGAPIACVTTSMLFFSASRHFSDGSTRSFVVSLFSASFVIFNYLTVIYEDEKTISTMLIYNKLSIWISFTDV